MEMAKPNADAQPIADMAMSLLAENEWLISQLAMEDCPVCANGKTYLYLNSEYKLGRVCNECGTMMTTLEQIKWNIKNKARYQFATTNV